MKTRKVFKCVFLAIGMYFVLLIPVSPGQPPAVRVASVSAALSAEGERAAGSNPAFVVPPGQRPKQVYIIGYLSLDYFAGKKKDEITDALNILADALSEKTGYGFKLFEYRNYNDLTEELKNGVVDFVFFNNDTYVNLTNGSGPITTRDIKPLAAFSFDGKNTHPVCLYVRKDGGVNSIEDLKGGPLYDDNYAVRFILKAAGWDAPLDEFFGYGGPYIGNDLEPLFRKDVTYLSRRSDKVMFEAAKDPRIGAELKTISCAGEFPNEGLFVRKGIPVKVSKKVADALTASGKDPAFAGFFSLFDGFNVGFLPITESDYAVNRSFDKIQSSYTWRHEREKTVKWVTLKNSDKKIEELSALAKTYPVGAYTVLAKRYHEKGMFDEEIEVLQKAIKEGTKNPEVYTDLANALSFMGRRKEAGDTIKKLIALDGKKAAPHAMLSNLYSAAGDKKQALKELLTAVRLSGEKHEYDISLMTFYENTLHDYPKAEHIARTILNNKKQYNSDWVNGELSYMLIRENRANAPKALELLKQKYGHESVNSAEAMALAELGAIYLRAWGDDKKADIYYKKAKKTDPGCKSCDLQSWWMLPPDKAIARCKAEIKAGGRANTDAAERCLAEKYFEKDDYKNAAIHYAKLRELNSHEDVSRNELIAMFKTGGRDKARRILETRFASDSYYNTGNENCVAQAKISVLVEAGEYDFANAAYQEYLKRWPKGARGRHLMAEGLAAQGRYREAAELEKDAVKNFPYLPEYYIKLSLYYAETGRRKDAGQALREAMKLKPAAATNYYWIGEVYKKLGDAKNARNMYREALKIEPWYPEARKALESYVDFNEIQEKSPESFKQKTSPDAQERSKYIHMRFACAY